VNDDASFLQLLGAGCFGAVVGWYLYFLNRYRAGDVAIADLVSVIGAVGGGAILALFPAESDLFGAYGIGLAAGFFGYFLVLVGLVARSKSFGIEWFLDGRRTRPAADEVIPEGTARTARAMDERDDAI
jgi:hypothetical protein